MSERKFYIDTNCEDVSGFDSGHAVFNEYLMRGGGSAVIHYLFDTESDALVAYFSLIASVLQKGSHENLTVIPAIELEMFALDKRYQGSGASSLLLDLVFETIAYYSFECVGAEVILLYSVPVDHVICLYESKGFNKVTGTLSAFKSDFTNGCIPMYMAI